MCKQPSSRKRLCRQKNISSGRADLLYETKYGRGRSWVVTMMLAAGSRHRQNATVIKLGIRDTLQKSPRVSLSGSAKTLPHATPGGSVESRPARNLSALGVTVTELIGRADSAVTIRGRSGVTSVEV